jgi:uncharacterized Zn finger protein
MLSWPAIERHFEAPKARQGRALYEQGVVHDLARTTDGELVARVHADRPHVVNVGTIAGIVSADCTCPEELDCEHAVAVLLQYQALVGQCTGPCIPAGVPGRRRSLASRRVAGCRRAAAHPRVDRGGAS